ncbi:MAG: thermonuclease family protein [Chloroflexi bacterium]|nr:thermonuclease family protein [Chloroflexota bacterium]
MKIIIWVALLAAISGCAFVASDDVETTLQCAECSESQVSRVFDGDTVIITNDRVVRIYGIDAPEGDEPCTSEATTRLKELAGETIRLENAPSLTDELGRRSAYLYTRDGTSIDEIMIVEGLATASGREGQHRRQLSILQKEARTRGDGCLWQ